MDDDARKNEIAKAMTSIEFYPAPVARDEVSIEKYSKLSLGKVAALGTSFEPIAALFQKAVSANGGSGLYHVRVPNGGRMFNFNGSSDFLGSVAKPSGAVGGGQARLNPIAINPATVLMAAALYNIESKLESIEEAQQEMLEFLQQKEKSALRGNLNYLTDVLNNYKYNWNNEQYKKANHIKVLDIKQESEQSILFYQEQINSKLKKQAFLPTNKDVKDKLKKIQSDIEGYQLALYLYSFSSFLEVMLLENYESAYLDAITTKIEDYAMQYRVLYTECYNRIEGYSESSVQSLLLGGLAGANKAAGKAAASLPVISKSQLDATLLKTGNRLQEFNEERTEKSLQQLAAHRDSEIRPFVDNINAINRLYNQPVELLFDEENIYLGLPEVSEVLDL